MSSNIRLETKQYNFHRKASSYATGWKEAKQRFTIDTFKNSKHTNQICSNLPFFQDWKDLIQEAFFYTMFNGGPLSF